MTFDIARLERRIAALEANRGASLRFGTVTEVNAEAGSARVQLPDGGNMVSMPLRVLQERTLKDQRQMLPDLGEPVAALFSGQGLEQGVILGAHYSTKTPPPNQPANIDYTRYEDGTEIAYDREQHKLTATVKGDAEIKTTGSITLTAEKDISLKAPRISLAGMLRVTDKNGQAGAGELVGTYMVRQGSLHVPDGDVLAGTVSVAKHLHGGVESGSGTTDKPVGGTTHTGGSDDPRNKSAYYEELFNNVQDDIDPEFSSVEHLLLCLPEIALVESKRVQSETDAIGWRQLQMFFYRWFSGKANNNAESNSELFIVDMQWILSYKRAKDVYDEFVTSLIYNEAAKKILAEILERDGYLTDSYQKFDYTNQQFTPRSGTEPWVDWKKEYFQDVVANIYGVLVFDGLTASMGNFNFRAYAAGYVVPLDQGHLITVTHVYVAIWDSFNFHEEDNLGFWNCSRKEFSIGGAPGFYNVKNSDFNKFRNTYQLGQDFMILSEPERVESFREFQYAIPR